MKKITTIIKRLFITLFILALISLGAFKLLDQVVNRNAVPTINETIIDGTVDGNDINVLVNKDHYLGDFAPTNLQQVSIPTLSDTDQYLVRPEVNDALNKLCRDIDNQFGGGCGGLVVTSAYRSYQDQQALYDKEYAKNARLAKKTVQPAGYSEHQLGLAVDLMLSSTKKEDYYNTPQAKWIKENAYRYGLIVRYEQDKVDSTKISYEPWHLRLVSKDLANYLYKNNLSMEEFVLNQDK